MKSTQNNPLPEKFDEQVTLEIKKGSDEERTRIRIRDVGEADAWIAAEIDDVVSLSERY